MLGPFCFRFLTVRAKRFDSDHISALSRLPSPAVFLNSSNSETFRCWSEKMKKGVLLNADVSAVVSRLGHTDQIVICDAGLPIPAVTQRIDWR